MINRKLLASDLFPVLSFLSPCPSPVHKSPPISPTLSADRSFKFTPETPRHTGGRRKPAPPLDDSRLSQNTTIEESPGGYAGGIDPNFGKPKAIFYSSSSDEELDPAALDDAEDASSPSFGLGGAAASTPSPIDYDALDSARPIDLGALDDAQPAGMMDMGFVTPPKQTSSLSMKVTPPTPELAARLKTFLKDNVALNTLRGTAQLNLFLRLWGYNTKPTPGISLDGKPTTVYTPIDNVDTVLSDVPAAALIFRSGKEGLMNRPPLHITFDEQEGLYYVNCYLTMFKVSSTSETTRKKVVCNIKGTYIVGNVINISNPVRALGFAHSYHVQNPAEAVPVIQAFRTTLGSLNTIFKYGAPVDQNAFGQFRI